MNIGEVFGNAKWVGAKEVNRKSIFFLRGKFVLNKATKATLRVLGLGYFYCYINGQRVGDDLFLPLISDFEPRENYPVDEVLTGHRMYVPQYDVTELLKDGENVITIHFGGGWYTEGHKFGTAKAIWRVFGEADGGDFDFGSSVNDKITNSFIYDYSVTYMEKHDYRIGNINAMISECDDTAWENTLLAVEPDTEYMFSDCPADAVCERLEVIELDRNDEFRLYDSTKNTTGYPVLRLLGEAGDEVRVVFSEDLTSDGKLDLKFNHKQEITFICDGIEREVHPLFTWFGFRYFEVYGNADVVNVEVVHSKVDVSAEFCSDNEILNWIHDAFLNTQLTNMHMGIPSDCPHIERRGYTGDGQLVCHTAMNILDAKKFYRKWIEDIRDCQDVKSGHVQYTAPYIQSGGGPGGWGCAIVEVPYEYYCQYGDVTVLEECYPQMLRYFDYLEEHSYGKFVVSDKAGEWCLGDWCTPVGVVLPAPFVNNYFYIKSLGRCVEIAKIIGKEEDIPMLTARIDERKQVVNAAYFNTWDGNFFGNVQGSNAFAVDMGIGDSRTYSNLVRHYEKLGSYDTGIFGTDIVTRLLFENGDGELAVKLITSNGVHSFSEMRRRGASTIWEYWPDSLRNRSHNHPMFGAIVGYFYDYLLGIRRENAAYESITVSPVIVSQINSLYGSRMLPSGKVSVRYEKNNDEIMFNVNVPNNVKARFVFKDIERELVSGECNTITVKNS